MYTSTKVLLETGKLYRGFMPISVMKVISPARIIQKLILDQIPFMALDDKNPPKWLHVGVTDGTWILHDGQTWWLGEDQFNFLEIAE